MCSRLEIIPNMWCGANFAEDLKMSCRHSQYFVRVGGVEVAFSWQTQGIVRPRCLVEVNVVAFCFAGLQNVVSDQASRFTSV